MDLHTILILLGTGVIGGLMASLVGGASVITFPVLLALGLSPVVATASNSGGGQRRQFARRGDRPRPSLPPFNRAFVGLVLASVLGALLGAVLLLATPERLFEFLIPLLLGFATVLFAFAGRITPWLRARASERGREWKIGVTSIPLVLPISIYGGYFGAGAGMLLLGVLIDRDRRRLSPRQRGEESGVEPQHLRGRGVVHRQWRGELAADAGDDGGLPRRRRSAARTWRATFRRRRCAW